MNKLNDIFNKIAKMEQNAQEVKLGKHEVELALIDEFKNLKSTSILESDVILEEYNQLKKTASLLNDKIKKYINLTIDLSNKSDEISAKYKELGLDFTKDNQYKDYRKAFENQRNILDIQNKLKSI